MGTTALFTKRRHKITTVLAGLGEVTGLISNFYLLF